MAACYFFSGIPPISPLLANSGRCRRIWPPERLLELSEPVRGLRITNDATRRVCSDRGAEKFRKCHSKDMPSTVAIVDSVATRTHGLYIGGEWVETPRQDEVKLPYDSSVVGLVAHAEERHVEMAVRAGSEGATAMAALSNYQRAELLLRIANRAYGNLVEANPAERVKREAVAQETLEDVVNAFLHPRTRVNETAQVRLDAVLYVTERAWTPPDVGVRIIVTPPERMEAAVAEVLGVN